MDLMQWTEIHCNSHHPHHNPHHNHQASGGGHHHLPQAPLHHHHHVHPNHNHNYNHHLNHMAPPQDHHLSSAPTIKNHSVTHFGGYLYCFGGYDGRRNHMTLLIYSIAEQRWIRPYMTNNSTATGGGPSNGTGSPMLGCMGEQYGMSSNTNTNNANINGPNNILLAHDHVHPGAYIPTQQPQPNHHHNQQQVPLHHHLHSNTGAGGDLMDSPPFGSGNANQPGPEHHGNPNIGNNNTNVSVNASLSSSPIWVSGTPPPGRNGHSATLVTDDDDEDENHPESGRIIVLGGWLGTGPLAASDMHVLDISRGGRQLHWYQPAVKGMPPGPCNMHSADYVKAQKSVYVFRGGNGREYLNDLHALNVDTMQWRRVETTGAIPQQRANHSSAILDEQLFIFGGWNGTERLNDIHILDTRTKNWTCPHVGGVLPHPRAGMTLTALRGRLYLFGGSGTSAKCFQDLQILDRQQMAWLDVSLDQDEIKPTGGSSVVTPPSNRYEEDVIPGHRYGAGGYGAPQQYDDSGQQPFGGFTDTGGNHRNVIPASRNELWRTRVLQQNQVINPNDEDSVPSVVVQGRGPGRRAGHTATAVNRKIYIFGGSCGSDYLNDFFVLDTDPPPQAVVTESNSLELIERRLRHFFNDEEFADVTFLVQGQRVYGHKMVLSIVSDYFRSMFSAGFRESAEMEIVIPDCSHAAFLAVMEYIYTGSLPKSLGFEMSYDQAQTGGRSGSSISESSSSGAAGNGGTVMDSSQLSRLVELLELADRFFLDHLKQVCETLLQGTVNPDTVEYLTSVAQKTNSSQLHEICKHSTRNRE